MLHEQTVPLSRVRDELFAAFSDMPKHVGCDFVNDGWRFPPNDPMLIPLAGVSDGTVYHRVPHAQHETLRLATFAFVLLFETMSEHAPSWWKVRS